MKTYEATEQAYKNGYEKGKQDAVKQCNNIKEYLDYAIHNPNGEACEYATKEDYNRAFQAEFDRLYNLVSAPNQWIPVTERLPEVCDSYLVVVKYKYDHEKEYDYDVDVATYYPYDNPGAYIDNRWDTYNDWDEGQQYIHITHWMPLPEPPKGE